ncbi:acyl-CoA dehydrogenase family protein [Rhizobacter sp. Root1221]|uniref:acyl-CoA dehydrogenase family protein n=1 Tax=Rhizobacter sp. Root1221 TaxID=1736433 RepID=UPI0009E7C67B|nr:acyl-CoA dehydrogenase [Rhizobacter sp. Root1221]
MTDRQSPSVELDALLAEAARDGGPFSTARSARLDALEAFPAEACRVLDDFGLPRYFVPAVLGGRLDDMFELMQLLRVVARRDLTVAIAYGKTFLGSAPVWVAGRPEQAAWLAGQVGAATMVTWALTERHHGSDLMAGELSAAPEAHGGWRLDGQKWLINNATRAPLVCLLARTRVAGGARGFTLFLVDKRQLTADSFTCLPKERTHGIRGADISGIAFHGAPLRADAVVGTAGSGIEVVLKTMQLTRTACVSLSLGAGDHALRLAASFIRRRGTHGRRLSELPNVRWCLGRAATGQLLCEAVSLVAARSIHALPDEMSVVAAITKAFVPSVADEVIAQAGELLGARAVLVDEYADGMFQKLERDHRIVGIFDGSTVVNRNGLINQFPLLARAYGEGRWNADGLEVAVSPSRPLPALDATRLSLLSRQGCSLVQSVPEAVRELRQANAGIPLIEDLAQAFEAATVDVMAELASCRPSSREVPAEAFELAWRYELCFAGAACLRLWLHRPADRRHATSGGALWRDAIWVSACLAHVLTLLGRPADGEPAYEQVAEVLLALNEGQSLTLLASGTDPETQP